jgi:hypothetical protein
VAQLYPRAVGSPFAASYDSKGYGGGILTGVHRGPRDLQSRVTLRLTVGQSVSMSWCRTNSELVTRHYFSSEGFCWKIAFLSVWGALSDEKSGLSFVSQSVVICLYEH